MWGRYRFDDNHWERNAGRPNRGVGSSWIYSATGAGIFSGIDTINQSYPDGSLKCHWLPYEGAPNVLLTGDLPRSELPTKVGLFAAHTVDLPREIYARTGSHALNENGECVTAGMNWQGVAATSLTYGGSAGGIFHNEDTRVTSHVSSIGSHRHWGTDINFHAAGGREGWAEPTAFGAFMINSGLETTGLSVNGSSIDLGCTLEVHPR